RAQDADAERVVKRAIEAAGGVEVLTKFPAGQFSAHGILYKDENTLLTVDAEQVYQVPGRCKTYMKVEAMGQKLEIVNVVNAGKTKYSITGSPLPIVEAPKQELIAAMAENEIAQLLPLLNDKKFTVKLDKTAKGEDDTVPLLVTAKSGGEYHVGFDRTTGYLT